MKILIVDDEDLARERLRAILGELPDTEVVGEARNGREAVHKTQESAPDIVLLDIRMPLMDGLEAARYLADLESPPAVIFCTAYDDHALAAFEANAVDYLVKPIRAERLRQALDRARRFTGQTVQSLVENAQAGRRSHICARVRGNLQLIPVGDVNFLMAEDKYVVVHYVGGQVLIEDALKALEDEFGDRFVRVHRNCLVARDKLLGLLRGNNGEVSVQLRGVPQPLEVSRRNLPALRKLVRQL